MKSQKLRVSGQITKIRVNIALFMKMKRIYAETDALFL